MLTPDEFDAASRIAAWNLNYGNVLGETTRAFETFIDALGACSADRSIENIVAVNEAGAELASLASRVLDEPISGVSGYDEPRIEALKLYLAAGQLSRHFNPNDDTDLAGLRSACHLDEARIATARATTYTRDLLDKAIGSS